eukprot:scaffold1167_cov152-Skeletonema_marinoi.AAC.8
MIEISCRKHWRRCEGDRAGVVGRGIRHDGFSIFSNSMIDIYWCVTDGSIALSAFTIKHVVPFFLPLYLVASGRSCRWVVDGGELMDGPRGLSGTGSRIDCEISSPIPL